MRPRPQIDELGEASGYSNPYLSQIENGKKKTKPSAELLSRLAGPLGVDLDLLMIKAGHVREVSTYFLMRTAYGSSSLNSEVSMMWGVIELTLVNEENEFETRFPDQFDVIEKKFREILGDEFDLCPEDLYQVITSTDWNNEQDSSKDRKEIFDLFCKVASIAKSEFYADKDIYFALANNNITYDGISFTEEDLVLVKLFLDTLFKNRIDQKIPFDQIFNRE